MSRSKKRRNIEIQVAPDGTVWIVDPDPGLIQIGKAIDPSLIVETSWRPNAAPAFQRLRRHPANFGDGFSERQETDILWLLHDQGLQEIFMTESDAPLPTLSLLDLKIELARRALAACNLCGHRCGVNRLEGEPGRCGLGREAYWAERFVHCGEEPPINPSLVVSLQGCSWRCLYCQQFDLLPIRPESGEVLDERFWEGLHAGQARSLTFVGGNPDESVYAILKTLSGAPEDLGLPIVWNSNLYGTPELYRVLDGVVDVYIPDLRYGNDGCAKRWSGIENYWKVVTAGLYAMSHQKAEIFVRILVLPGHMECCHRPALIWLARNLASRVSVRVMDQYAPMWRIRAEAGEMSRRPTEDEVETVQRLLRELGLRSI